ncbi:MAG: hypothetical protein ACYCXA_11125 [Actinomycetes bacterium]
MDLIQGVRLRRLAAQLPPAAEIDKIIRDSGATDELVAEACGVSRQSIWYWRTGHRHPSMPNAAVLVSVLRELASIAEVTE